MRGRLRGSRTDNVGMPSVVKAFVAPREGGKPRTRKREPPWLAGFSCDLRGGTG
jgi:hypothetical protein